MRIGLSEHIDEYVLAKGWITDWKIINGNTFQAYISSPVIKKPDKDILFDEQQIISKENHINLFLPMGGVGENDIPYKRYDCVCFAGYIRQYCRKDGTTDFGVYPVAQSTLHIDLMEMNNYLARILDSYELPSVETLTHFEKYVKPYIVHLEEELEDAGDLLPTFYHTYDGYDKRISKWKDEINQCCKMIRTIHSNRRMRRKWGIKSNDAQYVPVFNWDDESVAKMRKYQNPINKKALKEDVFVR